MYINQFCEICRFLSVKNEIMTQYCPQGPIFAIYLFMHLWPLYNEVVKKYYANQCIRPLCPTFHANFGALTRACLTAGVPKLEVCIVELPYLKWTKREYNRYCFSLLWEFMYSRIGLNWFLFVILRSSGINRTAGGQAPAKIRSAQSSGRQLL